jgi:exonuclease VII small subunit
MGYLALLAGLLLSGTAAYYSIVGLMAIFPGSTIAIVAMGASLEFAKLVVASWLYHNWKAAPVLLKGVFCTGVVILMFFTSMGIFGFLSKAHLEHAASMGADTSYQVSSYEQQIASKEKTIKLIERQIDTLDNSMLKYLEQGKVSTGLQQRNKLKADRNSLEKQRQTAESELIDLNTRMNGLKIENAKREVEVGPLKYIAELIYGNDAKNHFDSAVRAVIILIVAVFDPLAVLLLIAANMSFVGTNTKKKPSKKVASTKKPKYNNDNLYTVMMNDEFGIQHKKDIQ